jgi:hypothetical protein
VDPKWQRICERDLPDLVPWQSGVSQKMEVSIVMGGYRKIDGL